MAKAKSKAAKSTKKVAKKAAKPTKKVASKAAKKPAKKAAARKVTAIPGGFHSLTPFLIVRGAAAALAFYAKALGAKEKSRMTAPDGSVVHAELRIGDSMLMLSEESPQWGTKSPLTLGGNATHVMIYTKDAEAFVARAVAAGCELVMPVTPMFWGDRYGKIKDPYGHQWSVGTHFENVSPKEMQRRAEAWMKQSTEQSG